MDTHDRLSEQDLRFFASETRSLGWQEYLLAVLGHKWFLGLALLIAGPTAYAACVTYTAEGNIWIEHEQGPMSAAESNGSGEIARVNPWIQLLRFYQVLESVVVEQKLYLAAPEDHVRTFASFGVAEPSQPRDYELTIEDMRIPISLAILLGWLMAAIGGALLLDGMGSRYD